MVKLMAQEAPANMALLKDTVKDLLKAMVLLKVKDLTQEVATVLLRAMEDPNRAMEDLKATEDLPRAMEDLKAMEDLSLMDSTNHLVLPAPASTDNPSTLEDLKDLQISEHPSSVATVATVPQASLRHLISASLRDLISEPATANHRDQISALDTANLPTLSTEDMADPKGQTSLLASHRSHPLTSESQASKDLKISEDPKHLSSAVMEDLHLLPEATAAPRDTVPPSAVTVLPNAVTEDCTERRDLEVCQTIVSNIAVNELRYDDKNVQ